MGSGTQTSAEEHYWNKMGIQKQGEVVRNKARSSSLKIVKAAHQGIELTENLQQLIVDGDLLDATKGGQRKDTACSKVDASEATRGNTDSHNVIEIESSSTSASQSTSSDIDNIPLSRVYSNLHKTLSPSPSTKHQKKPGDDDTFVPMYPSVLERIGEMSQMRLNVCARLPADHPFQPPVIESFQSISADVEVVGEPAVFMKGF